MAETPLWARLGGWRVSRHPLMRAIYDRLDRSGVFVAQLDRFERPTTPSTSVSSERPADIAITVEAPTDTLPEALGDAPVAPGDRLVLARQSDVTVGWGVVSARPVYVPELHRRLNLEGAYLWRLYVAPGERGQGVGSALVARAVEVAARGFDEPRISALVAPDNLPSRRAFRTAGFTPSERFTSLGCCGRQYDRRECLNSP